MERSRFGLGLLLCLLILGILSTWGMLRTTEPMTESIRQAGDAGFREDWTFAEQKLGEAKQRWEETFPFCASLTDHEPMENINGLFAQLEIYGQLRTPTELAAVCARLSALVSAVGEAHQLTWWNLL
jgi:hypothetical protein